MDVLIDGVALSGEPTVTLHPRQQVIYQLTFAPTVIGEYAGRLDMAVSFKAGFYSRWSRCRNWSRKTAFDQVKIENRSL